MTGLNPAAQRWSLLAQTTGLLPKSHTANLHGCAAKITYRSRFVCGMMRLVEKPGAKPMPICFQLTPKGYTAPATIQSIDDAICQALDLPWDADEFVCNWYDVIGFRLAMGKTFSQITDAINDSIASCLEAGHPASAYRYRIRLRINHFLLENYTPDAWNER